MTWLSKILDLLAGYFGYAKSRSEARNAADVKTAAVASQEAAQVDKTNKAIAAKDTDEIRKELSE